MSSLSELVRAASSAPGSDRISFRDRIAAFGDEGIASVLPLALESDGGVAWFAVAVIVAAEPHASRSVVIDALRRVASGAADHSARVDAAAALARVSPSNGSSAGGRIARIPARAGHEWPGFQEREFGDVTGTVWRGRDHPAALSPIITRALRYLHPHFKSYSIYHSPEVHFGIRDRYEQGGQHGQGWRAGKLVIYAHGPNSENPDIEARVTAGLYLEKGLEEDFPGAPQDLLKFGLLDDRWDWGWFVRALDDPHVRDELGAAMARHGLMAGDYTGGPRFGPGRAQLGIVCGLEDGEPVLRRADGAEAGRGWGELQAALRNAPRRQWVDLHVWRTWMAEEAIEAGPDFALDSLLPVLTDLARVYIDVLAPALPGIPVMPDPSTVKERVSKRIGLGE